MVRGAQIASVQVDVHPAGEPCVLAFEHGLKMTGMPAWGATHDDQSIWGLVAFVRKLPELSPDAYRELVAQADGGHSHDEGHSHEDEAAAKETAVPLSASAVEPIAVVHRFFRALASGDTKSAGGLLDPKVLIYESGGAERSRAEYESHHLGADAALLKTATHRMLSRTGDAIGDLAWVATESRLTTQGAKATDVVSTETMVLRKSPQGWRIVHLHWSSRPQGA